MLSLVDLRHLTHTLNSFTRFNHARERREAGSYLDCAGFIDGRGNYAKYRCSHGTDEGISDEAVIDLDRFSDEEAMDRLACYYESLTAKGVEVFLCGAPVNRQGLSARYGGNYMERVEEYDRLLSLFAEDRFPIILSLADCLYDGRCFYDTDFHLSSEAAKEHTKRIIDGLRLFLS